MTNTTAAAAVEATRCLCAAFEIVLREYEVKGQPEVDLEGTGCTETTGKEFAPGHDAKLKSLLIRAGVAGLAVRNGSLTTTAEKAAQGFGFAHMVAEGIERGRAKAAAKADRTTTRAARKDEAAARKAARKPAAKAPAAASGERVVTTAAPVAPVEAPAAPETVEIKVGRWVYPATIVDGDAHYITAKGAPAVAVNGTYKIV